jgi:autonomous glycyl radical cofactor GrcA
MDPLIPMLVVCVLLLAGLVAAAIKRANGGGHAWHPGCALTVEVLAQRLAAEGGRHRLLVVAERQATEDAAPKSTRWPQLTAAPIAA